MCILFRMDLNYLNKIIIQCRLVMGMNKKLTAENRKEIHITLALRPSSTWFGRLTNRAHCLALRLKFFSIPNSLTKRHWIIISYNFSNVNAVLKCKEYKVHFRIVYNYYIMLKYNVLTHKNLAWIIHKLSVSVVPKRLCGKNKSRHIGTKTLIINKLC